MYIDSTIYEYEFILEPEESLGYVYYKTGRLYFGTGSGSYLFIYIKIKKKNIAKST